MDLEQLYSDVARESSEIKEAAEMLSKRAVISDNLTKFNELYRNVRGYKADSLLWKLYTAVAGLFGAFSAGTLYAYFTDNNPALLIPLAICASNAFFGTSMALRNYEDAEKYKETAIEGNDKFEGIGKENFNKETLERIEAVYKSLPVKIVQGENGKSIKL